MTRNGLRTIQLLSLSGASSEQCREQYRSRRPDSTHE
jgi:hypothetical protein